MSDSSPRVRGYALLKVPERVTSYVLPWAITVAAWPLALVLHFTIGARPLWTAFLAVGFTGLVYLTWRTWSVRRQDTRVVATLFVGAALTWELFAITIRPWQADVLRAWAVGGLVLSIAWCVRHAALSGVRDTDKSQVSDGEDGLLKKVRAFKNARVGKTTETDQELRTRVHLDAPTTAKEAQDARDQIAAVAEVGADQVKVLKVEGNESQVDLVFTPPKGAIKPVTWADRPDMRGRSAGTTPIWLGRRTDGSDIEWWLSGDPDKSRPLAHTKWTGVSGSGKTETMVSAILQMRELVDVVPIVGDPAKFEQSFGDVEELLGLAAKNEDEVKQLIFNLERVIEYRSGLFASLTRADGGTGYKEWVPEMYALHGVPLVFVDIEEAADVAVEMDEELDELLRKLRSIGVHLCLSMQTMPHDNISRKTRAALVQSVAHGQNEYQDAKYSLAADTLEAGADPTKWRNESPGSMYAEVIGTDRKHWPVDGRAPKRTVKDTAEALEASRPYWATLDEGTYRILARGLADEQAEAAPAAAVAAVESTVDDDFAEVEEMALTSDDGIDTSEPLAAPRGRVDVAICEPVRERMSEDDSRAELLNRINIAASGDSSLVTFEALEDLPALTGRPRWWVYDELERLADDGVLRRVSPPTERAVYEVAGNVFAEAAAG